ncbi:MAG: ribonuclease HII [Candidatus Omnitrophica bacterium]|nr:ribonuclease HII [Candidatus Omnitrophota bacterium]
MDARKLNRLIRFDQAEQNPAEGLLAGVDEVGIGPLAGPVVAAAVIFIQPIAKNPAFYPLNDSKQVPPPVREKLFSEILKNAVAGIGVVDEKQIDKINIYQAGRLAMKHAVLSLNRTPDRLLIDGRVKIDLPIEQKSIIDGDTKSAAIAAASIVAKVYRDRWMVHFDALYPGYSFGKHKGYGTREHLKKIRDKGPCPIHRRSFSYELLTT